MPITFSFGPIDPNRIIEFLARCSGTLSALGLSILLLPPHIATRIGVDFLQTKNFRQWIGPISLLLFAIFISTIVPVLLKSLKHLFLPDDLTITRRRIKYNFQKFLRNLTPFEWIILISCIRNNSQEIQISSHNDEQRQTAYLLYQKGILEEIFPGTRGPVLPYKVNDKIWTFLTSQKFLDSELFKFTEEEIEKNETDVYWFLSPYGRQIR